MFLFMINLWTLCQKRKKNSSCSTSETTSFWLISEIPLMFTTPSLKSPGFFLSRNFHFSRSNKFPNHHYTKKCNHDVRYEDIREELFYKGFLTFKGFYFESVMCAKPYLIIMSFSVLLREKESCETKLFIFSNTHTYTLCGLP